MARRLGNDEAARPLGGLVRARPGRLRRPAVAGRPLRLRRRRRPELGQRHGRPARRPVVRGRDRPRRPDAAGPGRRRRCGPSTALNVCALRGRADGRGQRHAARRHGRPLERAVGRGVGRARPTRWRRSCSAAGSTPRAGRPRAASSPRPTSAACGSGRPRRTTATATSAPRSTCARWRSGRSRRRCGGAPGVAGARRRRLNRGPRLGREALQPSRRRTRGCRGPRSRRPGRPSSG